MIVLSSKGMAVDVSECWVGRQRLGKRLWGEQPFEVRIAAFIEAVPLKELHFENYDSPKK
jgi:hypothetical protein